MGKSATQVTFEAMLDKFDPRTGWHFIPVAKEIAAKFGLASNNRRVICTLNGSETFQCALMPYNDAFFIMVNKGIRTRLGIEPGDRITVTLAKDESEYGMPMPEEFREVLDQDPDGDKLFHQLTPGKQRSLLYYVGKFKDIDRRIHASLIIMDHLRENGKVIDKKLHEELKRPLANI